jgi:hypothetical protein
MSGNLCSRQMPACQSYLQRSAVNRAVEKAKKQSAQYRLRDTSRVSEFGMSSALSNSPTIKTSEAHMGEWEFYRIPGSKLEGPPFLWSWRCRNADGTELTTPDTFRFLLDCVAHAKLHGYSGGPLQTQRDPANGGRWRAAPALRVAS